MPKKEYEKIIKENIEGLLPALIERVLGLRISRMKKIPFDVQLTLERRPDFLLLVQDADSQEEYLLQIEFQAKNDRKMAIRMLQYAVFLLEKHEMDIRQYVLYIGRGAANMPTEIKRSNIAFSYELIDLKEFDYEAFVKSDRPEEIILAILCDYHGHEPTDVIRKILLRLKELRDRGVRIDRYIRQLEIIANLRNLHEETALQTEQMALTYDLTKDVRYKQGIEKGLQKGKKEGIEKGKKEGISEGIEKGKKEGRELTRIKTLRKMLLSKPFHAGMITYADIAEVTEFSLKEVEAMHHKIKEEGAGD